MILGRQQELSHLKQMLTQTRGVCVCGHLGIGKTTLVRAYYDAYDQSQRLWCQAASHGAPNALLRQALQIAPTSTDTVVVDTLRQRGVTLIVFDHIQDLSHHARALDALLLAIPTLHVVVTSRERLQPPLFRPLMIGPLTQDAAVKLYMHHQQMQPQQPALPPDEVLALHELVDALGNLPLAVEDAAAQSSWWMPSELLDKLHQRFQWLTYTPGTAGRLETEIQASWDRFTPEHQAVLQQCCCFAQPADTQTINAVVEIPNAPNPWEHINYLLYHCVLSTDASSGKTTIVVDPNLQAFVRALTPEDLAQRTHQRLATHLVDTILPQDPLDLWFALDSQKALDRLETVLDSIRYVASKKIDDHTRTRCAIALALYAMRRQGRRQALAELQVASLTYPLALLLKVDLLLQLGHLDQADTLLKSIPPHPQQGLDILVMLLQLKISLAQGDDPGQMTTLQRVLKGAQALGHHALTMLAMFTMAQHLTQRSQTIPAFAMLERALALHDNTHASDYIGVQLLGLYAENLKSSNHLEDAQKALEKAIALAQSLGVRRFEARALHQLAMVFHTRQEYGHASTLYTGSLGLGSTDATSWAYQHKATKSDYGLLHMEQGELHQAQQLIRQASLATKGADQTHDKLKLNLLLGVLLYQRGHFESAQHCFEQIKAKHASTNNLSPATSALLNGFIILSKKQTQPNSISQIDPSSLREIQNAVALESSDLNQSWVEILYRLFSSEHQALFSSQNTIDHLEVGPQGQWFSINGAERVNMVRRGPMKRILYQLAKNHVDQPGFSTHSVDLFEAGWPESNGVIPESGIQRLYSTMNRLRQLGIDHLLMTDDEGYHFPSTLKITLEP